MTNEEIRKIYELKNQGYGYKKIANELNLAVSTIKSYLLRHKDEPASSYCLYCGRKLVHTPKKKKKKYCSSECKRKYYKAHPECLSSNKRKSISCKCCNKLFISYGSSARKYCSHKCYINARYNLGGVHYE